MHGKTILNLFIFCFLFSGIALAQPAVASLPIDKKATPQTVNLYNNLKALLQKGILFGHQDDLAYGVGWKYERGRSDIKDVTGDYPAVQGYEIGHLELYSAVNLDSVPFQEMKGFIQTTYENGGITTISWHLRNPLTGKTAWDPAKGTVASILPGGEKHHLYKSWLDKVALFMMGLKGSRGEAIPVIFRPFHELNGDWFWWGKAHCTPEEYKALYRFTVTYLRDSLGVHNFLYAWSPDRNFTSEAQYLERYPGDAYVDLVGMDNYWDLRQGTAPSVAGLKLKIVSDYAQRKNKLAALTETGLDNIARPDWYTGMLLKTLQNQQVQLSYVLVWANTKDHFWTPYKGHAAEADFLRFKQNSYVLFADEAPKMYEIK